MLSTTYKPGDRIPNNIYSYYVILHGHYVRTVKFHSETVFPELEDSRMLYIASG